MIRCFRDLRVSQSAMDLAVEVHDLCRALPKHEEYGLSSQMQRAAVTVPSNIAEGHSREYTAEYRQFISFAQGSLSELQTQLEVVIRHGYAAIKSTSIGLEHSATLSTSLYALRNALKARSN